MADLFTRAEAVEHYLRGFALCATATTTQEPSGLTRDFALHVTSTTAWLRQEAAIETEHGDAVVGIIAEARERYETETGLGAFSGEEMVDDDF